MEDSDLKIGKIKKKVETTLGISLPGDRGLYVGRAYLDALARRHPQDYLAILEEATSIASDPDFVSFSLETETLSYYRVYFKKEFVVVGVSFLPQGMPRSWQCVAIKKNPQTVGEVKRLPKVIARAKKD